MKKEPNFSIFYFIFLNVLNFVDLLMFNPKYELNNALLYIFSKFGMFGVVTLKFWGLVLFSYWLYSMTFKHRVYESVLSFGCGMFLMLFILNIMA